MKRILAFLLCLILLFSFAGCGSNDIEVVKAVAERVCEEYNNSTDKIVEGEIKVTVENATTVNVEHTVTQVMDASNEYLVTEADEAIMNLFVEALNQENLPEGHTVNVNSTYPFAEA